MRAGEKDTVYDATSTHDGRQTVTERVSPAARLEQLQAEAAVGERLGDACATA